MSCSAEAGWLFQVASRRCDVQPITRSVPYCSVTLGPFESASALIPPRCNDHHACASAHAPHLCGAGEDLTGDDAEIDAAIICSWSTPAAMLYSLLLHEFTAHSRATIWADFLCAPVPVPGDGGGGDDDGVRAMGAAMAAAHRHIVIGDPSCAALQDRACLLQAAVALNANSAAVRRVHRAGSGSALPRRVQRTVSTCSTVNSLEVRRVNSSRAQGAGTAWGSHLCSTLTSCWVSSPCVLCALHSVQCGTT